MYKNYNMNQLSLPIDLEYIVPKDDIAYLVNDFVESMPSNAFQAFYTEDGRPSYHPKMMLKIILCAYTQATFSGRKIEAMLKDSLRMMWLAQNNCPSYRTINRFRVDERTSELIQQCYVQFRTQLVSAQLIDEEAIYIDGTKIEANAQKYTFVWKKAIQTNEKKMEQKALELYQSLVDEAILPAIKEETPRLTPEDFEMMQEQLNERVETMTTAIETSSDTTERKRLRSERRPYKQQLKTVNEMVERKQKYQEQYELLGDRNSYSKTDVDATFMRMKDDYMKNGQLKAGYNLQIATEHQYVLGYEIYPNPTDTRTLQPFLQTLTEDFDLPIPPYIVADAGYGSETNYQYIYDTLSRTPLITYSMYYKEQQKKYKKNAFQLDNWTYNETDDYYTCPNGATLEFTGYSTRTDTAGMKRDFKRYSCTGDCEHCPLRNQCTTSKKASWQKTIYKNMNWDYFKHEMKSLLSEEKTGDIYRQRKIDVEPVFGYLKAILGFTRMSVRGKDKVRNELGIALMAVNIRKLAKHTALSLYKTIKKSDERDFSLIIRFFFTYLAPFVPDSFSLSKTFSSVNLRILISKKSLYFFMRKKVRKSLFRLASCDKMSRYDYA